ncbi:MAG: flagellar basal body P-ring formation chaperone FlgA [Planctomycetota bacterium]
MVRAFSTGRARSGASVAVVALAAGGLAALACPVAEARVPVRVSARVRAHARAAAGFVRLGDVARVEGGDPSLVERARSVRLGRAPRGSDTVSIARGRIEARLLEEGVPARLVSVTGEPIVIVSAGNAFPATAADAVRRRLSLELRQPVDALEVCVLRLDPADGGALTEGATFGISGRSLGSVLGRARYDLDVHQSGRLVGRAVAWTDAAFYRAGVVARRDVAAGGTLAPDDLEDALVAVRDLDSRPVGAATDAVGRRTARDVGPGRALVWPDFRTDDAVRAGEVVSVTAGSARCRIVDFARAEDAGAVGDAIDVRNVRSEGAYRARVTGLRRVEALP